VIAKVLFSWFGHVRRVYAVAGRVDVVAALACVTVVVAATGGGSPAAAATESVNVAPAVGGQGTTFTISFTAAGQDEGPDDFGDTLSLHGPRGTPCAGELLGDEIRAFGSGPATFRVGPRAPRPRFADGTTASYRVASPWCPGRYTGWIEEYDTGGSSDLGHFVFTVRPTRRNPGSLVARDQRPLDELPPDNRGVRIRPRRITPRDTVTVEFATGLTRNEVLGWSLQPPVRDHCPGPVENAGVFRPGRGRLRLGGHARDRGGNDHAVRVNLCTGRWIGFIGELPFTFVVHRRA
jgi:hypothetical protein